MKKITIKRCNPSTCTTGYEELWLDGQLIMEGDSYHNSISHKIDGFLECLKVLKIEHEVEYEFIGCKFYCD